jgi:hypothetical protein
MGGREMASDFVQKIRTDVDRDSQKVLDFLIRMLRIKSVNPRRSSPLCHCWRVRETLASLS